MPPALLRARTKAFAIGIIRFCRTLPGREDGRVLARQLLRSGTSVGANYRAACRPRSDADLIAKLGVVIEECDETAFWLELAIEVALAPAASAAPLLREADELVRNFVTARQTVKKRVRCR